MYLSPISDESSVLQALEQISHFKGLKDVEDLKIAHAPMFDNLSNLFCHIRCCYTQKYVSRIFVTNFQLYYESTHCLLHRVSNNTSWGLGIDSRHILILLYHFICLCCNPSMTRKCIFPTVFPALVI